MALAHSTLPTESATRPHSDQIQVAVDSLQLGPSARSKALDERHVEMLAELDGNWPPVVIWKDNIILDGTHRVAAARRLGLARITATSFEGTDAEAYIECVQRNIRHGLPLNFRNVAAPPRAILGERPNWSDRRIAEVCGIDPKTVARIRSTEAVCPTEDLPRLDSRLGKDGKLRPANPAALRERIVQVLGAHRDASLRTVASLAGASPETVRTVRNTLRAEGGRSSENPGCQTKIRHAVSDAPASDHDARTPQKGWQKDPALSSLTDARTFIDWFEASRMDEDWKSYVAAVPLSRVYVIADEARRRAERWSAFADAVESRARG